jgi:hypothetical protein
MLYLVAPLATANKTVKQTNPQQTARLSQKNHNVVKLHHVQSVLTMKSIRAPLIMNLKFIATNVSRRKA